MAALLEARRKGAKRMAVLERIWQKRNQRFKEDTEYQIF